MAGFWNKLLGAPGKGSDDPLRSLFGDYPPNPPRHPGPAAALSERERQANLADFLARRDERLGIVAAFLRGRGADPLPMLAPDGDGANAAHGVDAWLDEALPRRAFSPVSGDDAPNPDEQAFRTGGRPGKEGYDGFLADLGLLEGEAIRRRDPRFEWRINDLPDFADMGSAGRVCLVKSGKPGWAATVLEMDHHMLVLCHAKMAPRGNTSGHRFGELLAGAVAGAFDPR